MLAILISGTKTDQSYNASDGHQKENRLENKSVIQCYFKSNPTKTENKKKIMKSAQNPVDFMQQGKNLLTKWCWF